MAGDKGMFGCVFSVVVVAALLSCAAAQTTHVVGGVLGWNVLPNGTLAYSTWASSQTFSVGDILVFNFTSGVHNVARVSKAAFDSCNGTSTIGSVITSSPARITLDSAGEHYYICTFPQHCPLGQKLAINVTATAASPPSGTPSPAAAPAPSSTRAPVTYTVGDALGWIVPPGGPIAYSTWASNKTFLVGDTLVFNFTNGAHDVARVSKTNFDSCNGTSPIGSLITTSPARINLTTVGEHYYICTFSQHCPLGQKLAINVTGSSGTATPPASPATPPSSPSPATPPSSPATPPSSPVTPPSSATSPSGGPSSTSGGPPPPPANSAPALAVAGFSVTFLSIAIAFLF